MFKKRFFNLLLATILCFPVAHAQTDCRDIYDRESIYLRTDFWRGTTFVKGGQPHQVGFFLNRMKPEFESSPMALPLFKKSQRNMKIGFAAGLLGLGGTVLGAVRASKLIDSNGYATDEKRYRRNIGWMIASATLSAAVTLPLNIQARRHLEDAVWLRNREVLSR